MRAFVAAAVVALALASVSDEEVEQCVAECQQMQDTGLHCQSHYGDRRPHPLLVTVCTSGWKQGSLLGCRRACARESCFGLSVNQALLSKRDVACKSYEGQMPRPTVLETCREGFMLGAESRCHEVESELARAHAEEMAEHMRSMEMALEQEASNVQFAEAAAAAAAVDTAAADAAAAETAKAEAAAKEAAAAAEKEAAEKAAAEKREAERAALRAAAEAKAREAAEKAAAEKEAAAAAAAATAKAAAAAAAAADSAAAPASQ